LQVTGQRERMELAYGGRVPEGERESLAEIAEYANARPRAHRCQYRASAVTWRTQAEVRWSARLRLAEPRISDRVGRQTCPTSTANGLDHACGLQSRVIATGREPELVTPSTGVGRGCEGEQTVGRLTSTVEEVTSNDCASRRGQTTVASVIPKYWA